MTAMPPISSATAQAIANAEIFNVPDNNEALGEALTRLAGHINAAQYRFLKLLAALIERDAWHGGSGMKSPAHWLNYYCGIDLGAAREKVRVAKSLATLPLIDAAFSDGVISFSKVRAMTRAATPENEAHLLQVARHGTAQHVESLVRKFTRASRLSAPQQDKQQHEAREFSWYYDDDGMLVFKGRLPTAEGAAFLKAMDLLLQSRAQPSPAEPAERDAEATTGDVSAETPEFDSTYTATSSQKRADALVTMADLALGGLGTKDKPACSADKYQVVLHINANSAKHVSAETLFPPPHSVPTLSPPCILESADSQFPLAASVARRQACDASLVTVLEDDAGNVLNVGRKTRRIPPAIRRALTLRDRGCRFPGCCESRFVDAHHIHHWCDGGETSLDNLVLLCRHHHRLLHEEGFRIEKVSSGFTFLRPDGRTLPYALQTQFANYAEQSEGNLILESLAIEREHDNLGLHIDERTAVTRWLGEAMDYSHVVGTLMDIAEIQRHQCAIRCQPNPGQSNSTRPLSCHRRCRSLPVLHLAQHAHHLV